MAPAARTRSNSKVTSAPAVEDQNKSLPAATPSEVAASGYPGKPSDKAKGVPKALHFKNGVIHRLPDHKDEDTASDGEGDGERTLEEELARTLIGADALDTDAELANRLDKGKGKETEVTPGTVRTVSPKILDAGKELARKLAGRQSTLVPIPAMSPASSTLPWSATVVAAATAAPVVPAANVGSPFLAPSAQGPAQAAPAIFATESPATVVPNGGATPTTTAVFAPTGNPARAPSTIAATAPNVAPALAPIATATVTNPAQTSSTGPNTVTAPFLAPTPTTVPNNVTAPVSAPNPTTATPAVQAPVIPAAPPVVQVAAAPAVAPTPSVAAARPVAQAPVAPVRAPVAHAASSFASVAASTASTAPITRSATRRAQAIVVSAATPSSTPSGAPAVAGGLAPTPAATAAVATPVLAPVAAMQPIAAPIAAPAITPALAAAVTPTIGAQVFAAAAAPAPDAGIPQQLALVAPTVIPVGVAPMAAGAAATVVLQCTPPPPGGFPPVYGWTNKNIKVNVSDKQVAGLDAVSGSKIMTYEYGGSHFKSTNPPSNFQEHAKNAIAQHFGCPAPLIGPAEAATIPPVFGAPFVWILTSLPQQHMQTMINQVVWSFPTVTLFALAYQPEISHFLFTLDGLLFSPDQGVDVANLVADTYRTNPQAQAFLVSICVSATELTNPGGTGMHTAWTVTAQPPTTNVDEHETWISLGVGSDYPTALYAVGKPINPPLSCTGCKSLGHPEGRCPLKLIAGFHTSTIANSTPTAPAPVTANDTPNANQGQTRGRGGNRGRARGGRGVRRGARSAPRGRGF
ncbi:hypothetical protein B0H13DRAFT_2309628 [Mycena leptocephala]|nr:hypothetical protein B0H13DRAFT_2309628 [Mycena leptocephala]